MTPTELKLTAIHKGPVARLADISRQYLGMEPAESVSAAFQRACNRLGIVDLHFHDLRHEGITRLFESGLSIEEVAVISGHRSQSMLHRYTHLSAVTLAEKMNGPT